MEPNERLRLPSQCPIAGGRLGRLYTASSPQAPKPIRAHVPAAPPARRQSAGGTAAMDDARNWIRKRVEFQSAKGVKATEPVEAAEPPGSDNPAAEAAVAEPEPHQSGVCKTFIDRGAKFEGTLRLRESFCIENEFRGEIVSEGKVTVAESAGIQANVRAREVVIAGAMVGDVKAARQVVIRAGGRLHGDIETPCLEVEKGAFFNGRTSMARPELALRAAVSVQPEPRDDSSSSGPRASAAGSAPPSSHS